MRASRLPELPEAVIQTQCVELLDKYERQGRLTYCAVPNGTWLQGDDRQRAIQMNKLKATGLRPGFPDIAIFLPGKTAFAELKRRTGRLAENQEAWRDTLQAMGFPWRLVRSVEDMGDYLRELGI